MPLSLQEISDRFEIQDLLDRYAQIIDAQDFDALKTEIFHPDAQIDYSVFGGPKGSLDEIVTFLKQAMPVFSNTQHLNANMQIKVEGDTATGRIMCFNPQEMNLGPEKGKHLFMLGLWYVDQYVRTENGWRIMERAEEKSWHFNLPDFMRFDN